MTCDLCIIASHRERRVDSSTQADSDGMNCIQIPRSRLYPQSQHPPKNQTPNHQTVYTQKSFRIWHRLNNNSHLAWPQSEEAEQVVCKYTSYGDWLLWVSPLGDASSPLLELEPEPESDTSDGNVPGDASFRGHSESKDNIGNESAMLLPFLQIVKHNDMGMLE
ncbi:hypothetical protein N7509_010148 [Penicillium cosmopolitanum]|uniref:Uncharacterized protein n=1 Tax=Penicillium cosmopolitanum TaxID=1131564 RepID=A0A9X0B4B4_9EURO|nr:uncharacterized protein N7509_010148 [Penicillium cosmopolitanum]KAJ5387607.1 hypothetical protein N7509_010148 [Penicillium cosmopolitanum]